MANIEKTLKSGATLNISSATFKDAHGLFKVVMKELGGLSFNDEMNQRLMINLLSSDEVEAALWPCMARATYNKVKINPELFDTYEEAREDYLDIAGEVLGFNLNPFLRGQSLLSMAPKEKIQEPQGQP